MENLETKYDSICYHIFNGVKNLSDGWTVKTADGRLSAHYENTVAILPEGPQILTLIDKNW